MHEYTQKLIILFVVLIPVLLIGAIYYYVSDNEVPHCERNDTGAMELLPTSGLLFASTTMISVELAITPAERERGLSYRTHLSPESGMIFVFPREDKYAFWMPDMCFAIDIIWIDKDWRIVDIAHSVTPESYPNVFTPMTPALYVLEVSEGMANKLGLDVGTHLRLETTQK